MARKPKKPKKTKELSKVDGKLYQRKSGAHKDRKKERKRIRCRKSKNQVKPKDISE